MEPTPTPPKMITLPPELAMPAPSVEPTPAPEMITPAPGVESPAIDTSVPIHGDMVVLSNAEVASLNPASVTRIAESATIGTQTPEEANAIRSEVHEAYNSAVQAATENINSGAESTITLAPEIEPPTNPEVPQV